MLPKVGLYSVENGTRRSRAANYSSGTAYIRNTEFLLISDLFSVITYSLQICILVFLIRFIIHKKHLYPMCVYKEGKKSM